LALTLRVALILSIIVPLVISIAIVLSSYSRAIDETRQRLAQTAAMAAEQSLKTLQGSDAILSEVSEYAINYNESDKSKYIKRITKIEETLSFSDIVALSDKNGDVFVASNYRGASINIKDRDYFSHHVAKDSNNLYLGEPVVFKINNKLTIPVSKKITDGHGQFMGVAFLSLDRDDILKSLRMASQYDAEKVGLIKYSDKMLVMSNAVPASELSESELGARLRHAVKEARSSGYIEVPDSSGQIQMVAFSSVGDYEVYAFAAHGFASVYKDWLGRIAPLLLLILLGSAALFTVLRLAQAKESQLGAAIAELARSNIRYKGLFQNTPDCIFMISENADGELYFSDINLNSETLFGIKNNLMIGQCVRCIFKTEEAEFLIHSYRQALLSGELLKAEHQVGPIGNSGSYWDLRMIALLGPAGDPKAVIGSVRNTARQRQMMMSLRDLSARLLQRQDQERRHMARELHDSAAQNLLAASLEIKLAADALSPMKGVWHGHLQKSRDFIESTQKEIRGVSYLLHPPMLDEAGLPNALRWLVDGFQRRTNVSLCLTIAPEIEERRFAPETELAFFRIAQEALTNVHRHANAQNVALYLGIDAKGVLEFRVEDDGIGTGRTVGSMRRDIREGVGISGMRERLRALDGALTLHLTEAGTVIVARLPVLSDAA
jgi:two-component system NarL family sensor kinase